VPDVSRRRCSKPSCTQPAVSTLTYVYADSTAVVGPLATYAEPHCYDLCQMHSDRLTAPKGWEVVRITPDPDALKPTTDDLEALANAVREAAKPRHDIFETDTVEPTQEATQLTPGGRRSHLRVVPDASTAQFAPRRERESEKHHDDAHPVFAPRPGAPPPDEPFDHEGLW
jgi:hypothetical protein